MGWWTRGLSVNHLVECSNEQNMLASEGLSSFAEGRGEESTVFCTPSPLPSSTEEPPFGAKSFCSLEHSTMWLTLQNLHSPTNRFITPVKLVTFNSPFYHFRTHATCWGTCAYVRMYVLCIHTIQYVTFYISLVVHFCKTIYNLNCWFPWTSWKRNCG